MQDRPTAPELLDALAGFMRDRAEHARDRWERFQFQVAANSIGIIRRELELDDAYMREEWVALDGLLGAEACPEVQAAFRRRLSERNADLSERVRSGAFDGDDDRLVAYLWLSVVNKVRIVSPNEAP